VVVGVIGICVFAEMAGRVAAVSGRATFELIRERLGLGVVIKLAVGRDTLDLAWTERWVRDRIIGRIPGGRHIPGRKQSEHSESDERGGS
jgi:hypothetical protein